MTDLWFTTLRALAATMPGPCGPSRVTLAPPGAVFGPWAPVVAMVMDPGRNPFVALGLAMGPFAWAVRIGEDRT